MPPTIGVVNVDPNGETVVVDITNAGGARIAVYTTAAGSAAHSLPVTISARTAFYFAAPIKATFSVLYNGIETAGSAGATRTVDVAQGTGTEFSPGTTTGPSAEDAAQAANTAHLAGTEIITGNKTFSGTNVIGATTVTEAKDITFGTVTGSKIGTAITEKIGFYNATPIAQRAGAAQAAVVGTATTQTTPFGFATQAQGDAVVALVNELRAWAVAQGFIKGAA